MYHYITNVGDYSLIDSVFKFTLINAKKSAIEKHIFTKGFRCSIFLNYTSENSKQFPERVGNKMQNIPTRPMQVCFRVPNLSFLKILAVRAWNPTAWQQCQISRMNSLFLCRCCWNLFIGLSEKIWGALHPCNLVNAPSNSTTTYLATLIRAHQDAILVEPGEPRADKRFKPNHKSFFKISHVKMQSKFIWNVNLWRRHYCSPSGVLLKTGIS